VFPGEPDAQGQRGPFDADILLRHILRRALRKAGLPPLRFHDLRHMAGTAMHEAGVPLKRAQEILGHASERTTLAIYTHSMRRTVTIRPTKSPSSRGSQIWETFGKQLAP
jgi:integrase